MLTAFDAEEHLSAALHGGAAGFLLKDTAPQQLEYAIGELAKGNVVIDPRVARTVVHGYVSRERGRSVSAGSKGARLAPRIPTEFNARGDRAASPEPPHTEEFTTREREVLDLLAEDLSNNEIGEELHIGTTTVKDHVSALLGKLGVTNRVQAAVRAHQRGLVSVGEAAMRRRS
jgi:DNA-binding NarL/FixJ family response regulator